MVERSCVNRLYKCQTKDSEEEEVLAVKVFGSGTEQFFNREEEKLMMMKLHEHNVGLPLYCM